MSELQQYIERHRAEDEEFRYEYDRLGPLNDAIAQTIRYRHERGLTQAQLAKRMGKKQPAIARFESGRVWPSLAFLQDLAEALNVRLVMRLEPKDEGREAARVAEKKASYSDEAR
jgi:transcriptional regulator with XRE-family HTH domain